MSPWQQACLISYDQIRQYEHNEEWELLCKILAAGAGVKMGLGDD